jgi:uncharacterized protein DUF664
VSTIERPVPPLNADERSTLESWLDFHRTTLAMKCAGVPDDQAAVASVPPSGLTLTGLVQHMAEVERNWFRRVLAGQQAPPIYDPQADPAGPDGGFEVAAGATLRDALATSGRRKSPGPASFAPAVRWPTPAASWPRTSACAGSTST